MEEQRPIANMAAPGQHDSPGNNGSDVPKDQSPGHPSFRRCVYMKASGYMLGNITDRLPGNAHRVLAK